MTLVMVVGLGRPPSCAIQVSPWFMCQRANFTVSIYVSVVHNSGNLIYFFFFLIHLEMRISGDRGLSILYGLNFSFEDWLQSSESNGYWRGRIF